MPAITEAQPTDVEHLLEGCWYSAAPGSANSDTFYADGRYEYDVSGYLPTREEYTDEQRILGYNWYCAMGEGGAGTWRLEDGSLIIDAEDYNMGPFRAAYELSVTDGVLTRRCLSHTRSEMAVGRTLSARKLAPGEWLSAEQRGDGLWLLRLELREDGSFRMEELLYDDGGTVLQSRSGQGNCTRANRELTFLYDAASAGGARTDRWDERDFMRAFRSRAELGEDPSALAYFREQIAQIEELLRRLESGG